MITCYAAGSLNSAIDESKDSHNAILQLIFISLLAVSTSIHISPAKTLNCRDTTAISSLPTGLSSEAVN